MHNEEAVTNGQIVSGLVLGFFVGLAIWGFIAYLYQANYSNVARPHDIAAAHRADAAWHERTGVVTQIDAIFRNNAVVTVAYRNLAGQRVTLRSEDFSPITQVGDTSSIWLNSKERAVLSSSNPGSWSLEGSIGHDKTDNGWAAVFAGLFGGAAAWLVAWGLFCLLFMAWNRLKYFGQARVMRARGAKVRTWCRNHKRRPRPSPEVRAAQRFSAELQAMVQTPKVLKAREEVRDLIDRATDRDNTRAEDISGVIAELRKDVELDLEAQEEGRRVLAENS